MHKWTVTLLAVIAALTLATTVSGQLPPSIRASIPERPELTDEERKQACPGLRTWLERIKQDDEWLKQPFAAGEVGRLEKTIVAMGCAMGNLEGTWTVTSTDSNQSFTIVATAVDKERAFKDWQQWFGGRQWELCLASTAPLRYAADTFYVGTMTFSSEPPWRGSGVTKNEASFVVCGDSTHPRAVMAGKFGILEGDGRSTPRLEGMWLLYWDSAREAHMTTMNPLVSQRMSSDWKLTRIR
jgi:hypothetical protein